MEVVSRSFGLFINHSYWGILSISIENMFCVQNCLHAVSRQSVRLTYRRMEGGADREKWNIPFLMMPMPMMMITATKTSVAL